MERYGGEQQCWLLILEEALVQWDLAWAAAQLSIWMFCSAPQGQGGLLATCCINGCCPADANCAEGPAHDACKGLLIKCGWEAGLLHQVTLHYKT